MLTEEQERAAARRQGPLLLTAGAGSGKTSVLVERFVRAVLEDGAAPSEILAITFTERAAGELRERIKARLCELGVRDGASATQAPFVGTIHGFCVRLLRAHPLAAGLDSGFTVIDEGQADRMRELAFKDALSGFLAGEAAAVEDRAGSAAVDLVAAYGAASLQKIVVEAHAAQRSRGESRPRLVLGGAVEGARDERAERAVCQIDDLMCRFDAAYCARKRARAFLDFDDLELCARELLLVHPGIRSAWVERFRMVMVDEFQDTNPRQLALLELLARENLFTVGDELQSIYGFRHADPCQLKQRRALLERQGAALELTHNFRSRAPILEAVDRVFAERIGDSHTPLVATRAASATEPIVELLLTDTRGRTAGAQERGDLPEATPWRIAEARLLAARISELVQSGAARAGEVAVLLRAVSDMPLYEAALRDHNLPAISATGGFWGHRQVADLLAYLRVLANPFDELALYSTLACPLAGLSSDALVLLARAARERRCPVWEALDGNSATLLALSPSDRARLESFREWFAAERSALALSSLPDMLRRAVVASGYDTHVLSLEWGERRLANVHKLVALAARFEAREGRDLRGFLDHATHLGEALAGREVDAPAGEGSDAVRLMSIHAAKGLEFAVVCVADLGRAPRLTTPDLIVQPGQDGGRLGLRLRVLGEPDALPAFEYESLREELLADQQAEEDRILYVAMTRASERLLLCGAADFERWPSARRGCAPIAWLVPALLPDAATLMTEGPGPVTSRLSEGLSVRCLFDRFEAPAEREQTDGQGDGSRAAPLPADGDPRGAADSPERLALEELDKAWPIVRRLGRAAVEPSTLPLEDPDGTISYSSLVKLERCGYRYYMERVLGMEKRRISREQPHTRGRVLGRVAHALLERLDFARSRPPQPREVARIARELGMRLAPRECAHVAELVSDALDSELARRIAAARHHRREHPFAFSLGPRRPLVTGVLDLIAEEDDGEVLIVDYKSDRLSTQDDLHALVSREYELQRLLYCLAALQAGAAGVHLAHWFLERPHEPVFVSHPASDAEGLRELLLERLEELREVGFAVSEVPHRGICLTCPGRGTLCSWEEAHTMRKPSPTLGSPARVATLSL